MTQLATDAVIWPSLPLGQGLSNFVAPYAFARSAIFSTQVFRSHLPRPHYSTKTELFCLGSLTVFQITGEQLDQNDADVFYELLRRAIEQASESTREARVQFNRISLLKALGRSKGGKTMKLLDDSVERLTDATFDFQIPGLMTGRSRLILKALKRDDVEGLEYDYDVLIDLELSKLFDRNQWTFLNKSVRHQLAGDPLAKGLYAYFSTHSEPFAVRIKTMQSFTGRESMQASKFRAAITSSLANLKAATGWHICEIAKSGRDAGMVVVEKQARESVKTVERKPFHAPKAPSRTPGCGNQPRSKPVTWDSLKKHSDFVPLSVEDLVSLMDSQARVGWERFLAEVNTDDEDILWRAARGLLNRQWDALQAERGPAVDDDDDI